MKALVCEMCGSNDVVKQEGLFVCQNCGTKYSVEAARKLMIEGSVEVHGTVKIDDSLELKNLYEIAHRAKEIGNKEKALKYYDMILVKDPSSWEANFYSNYYQVELCPDSNKCESGKQISNCLESVVLLLKENASTDNEIQSAVLELYSSCIKIATELSNSIEYHVSPIIEEKERRNLFWYKSNKKETAEIMYVLGDLIDDKFGSQYSTISVKSWEEGITIHAQILKHLNSLDHVEIDESTKKILWYGEKIKKYKSEYSVPQLKTGGCYIATAVYGSYNCPEVWTLRRFRDNTLDATWYGRTFIKTYYVISPMLVKWFGDTVWFKKIWRGPLDRMVCWLQGKGVKSTPYQDKFEYKKQS